MTVKTKNNDLALFIGVIVLFIVLAFIGTLEYYLWAKYCIKHNQKVSYVEYYIGVRG